MPKTTKNIPKLKSGKQGRPAIDWAQLYNEWVKTKKPRTQFLREKGIDPTSGAAKRNTRNWVQDTKKAHHVVVNSPPTSFPAMEVDELWQIIQGWRKGQALLDYESAELLYLHCSGVITFISLRN